MTLDEYQERAWRTVVYPEEMGVYYCALGLAGEAGEVANKVKKVLRDSNGKITPQIAASVASELGDVLWYVACLAYELNWDLSDVARLNTEKLNKRKEAGTLSGSGDER